MPEMLPEVTSVDFDVPIKHDDSTGVETDENTTLRFGYRVKPAGAGCLNIEMAGIPEHVMTWLLEQAKAQEEAKG